MFETPNMSNIVYGNYFRYVDFTHKIGLSPITMDGLVKSTMTHVLLVNKDKRYISIVDILKNRSTQLSSFIQNHSVSVQEEPQSIFKRIISAFRFLIFQPIKVFLSIQKSRYYLNNFE